jgi:hypothetical protein
MVSLPTHKETDGIKEFIVDKDEKATIIFKCEGVLKDILYYLAKSSNTYGNTITSVITEMITTTLKDKHSYTFDKTLDALQSRSVIRSGEAIPYHIKSAMENAIKFSNPAAFADELAAGKITAAEVKEKVDTANATIMSLMEQGYNPNDFHPNKKSFGYKWSEGSWIWEVSRKSDEEEVVSINGREVTRLKAAEGDTHYLQYIDNGITIICPNIFMNALYMSYPERDEYFNRELRKVDLQHQQYKNDGKEYDLLIDECCPEENVSEAKKIISASGNEVIGAHMVKLERKGARQYRYMCIDVWNKSSNTYQQLVFMNDRGANKEATTKPFYQVFTKVEQKSRKKTNKKKDVEIAFTDEHI